MSLINNYDFDSNNQDDEILNGVESNHSLDEFNDINCSLDDLDNLDFTDGGDV